MTPKENWAYFQYVLQDIMPTSQKWQQTLIFGVHFQETSHILPEGRRAQDIQKWLSQSSSQKQLITCGKTWKLMLR